MRVECDMGRSKIDTERAAQRGSLTVPRAEVLQVLAALGHAKEGGVSLDDQMRQYGQLLGAWTEPKGQLGKESRDQAITSSIRAAEATLDNIRESGDLVKLQGHLVILNCNEFLLRQNPSREEFSRLVYDLVDWKTRLGAKSSPQLTERLYAVGSELREAAFAKFDELKRTA